MNAEESVSLTRKRQRQTDRQTDRGRGRERRRQRDRNRNRDKERERGSYFFPSAFPCSLDFLFYHTGRRSEARRKSVGIGDREIEGGITQRNSSGLSANPTSIVWPFPQMHFTAKWLNLPCGCCFFYSFFFR